MDEIDRKIIDFVQRQGRAGYAEIGAAAGLSVSAANERLRKLQDQGIITGYAARLAPAAAGLPVLAFMFVSIDRPEHEQDFLAAVARLPQIQECHHVTGDWSYLLKIRLGAVAELETLLASHLKPLPGLIRTHTMIALSSAKETAVLPVLPAAGGPS